MTRYPQAEFLLSTASAAQFPDDFGAEVAFAGRSNAGKSTAINVIVGRKALARTSKMPGRTRLVNFFQLAAGRRLVDLPGYGYATASAAERASWAPMIDALAQRESLRGLFLMVDSRRGLLPGDETLLDWAASAGCPVHVLLSKVDKLGRAELSKTFAQTQVQLGARATVQPFSAISGQGLDEARSQMDRWLQSGS
ncbi:MAG TPA: ribosome biogenesis GTP-binding protein YihA/YsxC [Steroidobacteraceae bacterium]